ncbi:MAG: tetratricopeptide repeat protein [Pseudomonadota bacterium]
MQALQLRQSAMAVAVARALVREVPDAADSQQLLGMCLAEAGLSQEAERAFRRALELAPGSEAVVLNFSAWLRQQKRLPEAAQCLARGPDTAPVWLQQGLLALRMKDHPAALRALQRAVALQPGSVQAWHGLGNAARGLDDFETAEAAFRKALALSPQLTPVWVNLGMTLRLQGRFDEAMLCLQQAELLGHAGPELADTRNGLLAEMARPAEALRGARQLVLAHPQFAQGHETLAQLLWEHGARLAPSEDPLAALCAAAARQPDHHELWQRSVNMLLSARRGEEALSLIQQARQRAPALPLLDWHEAEALDALGRYEQASVRYAEAHRMLGDGHGDFLNAYIRHAFRTGRVELAQSCANTAVARDATNQEAWSHLGTAWRLLGDAREHWLCDYERLVGFVEVPPPAAYADSTAFLASLSSTLDGLHTASREPINQSVRSGSQTAGRLFGRANAVLTSTRTALQQAAQDWLRTLPQDTKHPFLSRRRDGTRMVGSWSVRLWSAGHHSNHIHPLGWMSSAFYVALPPCVEHGGQSQHAGWLQFGQPLEELGLGLAPRHLLQPKPSHLALFPSYFWHGTVPFDDPAPRLTVAFDMQPALTAVSR